MAVQQAMALRDIMDVGRSANDAVHQARISIDPNVGLHAKVPLVALFGLMHLGVTLVAAVFGGAGRGNQGGINYRADSKHQAFRSQSGVDGSKQLHAQVVLFKQLPKSRNSLFVGQPGDASV